MKACLLQFFTQGQRASFHTCEVHQPDVDEFAGTWQEIAELTPAITPRVVPAVVLKKVQGDKFVRVRAKDVVKQATNGDTPVRVRIILYIDDDLYPSA